MAQEWQVKNIYLYLVCFVTLMMIVFGLVFCLNGIVRYIFAENYSHYPTLMEIEQEYLNSNRNVPSVAELEAIRKERLEQDTLAQQTNRTYQLRDLISSLAVWLIPIPFYLYHWRRIKDDLFTPEGVDSK